MQMEEVMVLGDGWVSDDSSFYGDEELQTRLKDHDDGFGPKSYWTTRSNTVTAMARMGRATASKATVKATLYNPYEGFENGRQLSETIPQFAKRLSPLTYSSPDGFIWIANPFLRRRDQGEADLQGFFRLAEGAFENFMTRKKEIVAADPGKPQGTITRKLKPDRENLKQAICEAAVHTGLTSGKWMLFPRTDDVLRTWFRLAEAVASGKLGTAAKIATDPGPVRLICIYTKDFSDFGDVQRVVEELANMGLVSRDGSKGIHYKCDAYTHLDIMSGNAYGLAASVYSSRDILSNADPQGSASMTLLSMKGWAAGLRRKRTADGQSNGATNSSVS